MVKNCPFCEPQISELENIVLENEHCLFIQQPQSVLIGSGLIIPRLHRETVFDLTTEEWLATHDLVRRAKALLDKVYAPNGYNLGWNVEQVGGQEIFHAHLHIIPRFADEPFAGKGIRYWLKQPTNQRSR
jgi:diadenosine tetraphosphate (Ap4A) HIT family hydrolase